MEEELDGYRSYNDVDEVIDLLVPLVSLRIALLALSPQLLDLLSAKLHKLSRLELAVRYVLPHATDKPRSDKRETQIVSHVAFILTSLVQKLKKSLFLGFVFWYRMNS